MHLIGIISAGEACGQSLVGGGDGGGMVICFLFNFADFSLIEIIFSYPRFWNFVLGS